MSFASCVRIACISLILLTAASAAAQTTPPKVVPNTPIVVEWDTTDGHLLANGLNWRALVDGAITKNFVGADLTVTPRTGGGQTFRATIPGVAAGQHTLVIREYCCVPVQQADSLPLTFVAELTPTPPSLPRIITGTISAQFRIEIQSDTALPVPAEQVVSHVLRIPNKH